MPARLSPSTPQPATRPPRPLATTSADLSASRLRVFGTKTPRRVLPPYPPPPPQLTLPALAAIVTLTETYPVHCHGNAHPFQGPSYPLSLAVVRGCHVNDAVEAMFVEGREEGKLIFNAPLDAILVKG